MWNQHTPFGASFQIGNGNDVGRICSISPNYDGEGSARIWHGADQGNRREMRFSERICLFRCIPLRDRNDARGVQGTFISLPLRRCCQTVNRCRRKDSAKSLLFKDLRSEEHTSELQSLMRISYAVFCLTKTKQTLLIHII